ncbi:unnamed protein product [Coregonus sp. 'balchen']|nr:unnamed protein product [Coregonus sp. 'balchen']
MKERRDGLLGEVEWLLTGGNGFCELTGFSRAEVMQKSCACKFLYGPESSETIILSIDDALDERKEFKEEIIMDLKVMGNLEEREI